MAEKETLLSSKGLMGFLIPGVKRGAILLGKVQIT
jgi:hypothetical protein